MPDNRRLVVLLVGLGLLLRLASVLAFPVYPLVDNTEDTEIYDHGARTLAAGQGYQWGGEPTAFFPIGWPLLLSFVYQVAGVSARAGQFLNFGFSLLLLLSAWALVRRLYGAAAGRLALVVLALAPHQFVYPAFLMSETSFTALFTASLALLAAGTGSVPRLLAAGLLMGMATLVRGPALVYPAFVLALARFGDGRSWRGSAAAALLFGVALLLPLAPWAVRNHAVFGRWVLVANDGGMNFLMGNHHGATGARHEPAAGLPQTGSEVADDREGYRRGLEFIRERPLEFLSLLPRKLVRLTAAAPLLTYRAELVTKWPRPLAWLLLGLDQLLHAALWLLAAVGLWRVVAGRRRGPPDRAAAGRGMGDDRGRRFTLLALGLWVAVHLAFLGGARYFFPVMPLLVALAVAGLLAAREGRPSEGPAVSARAT